MPLELEKKIMAIRKEGSACLLNKDFISLELLMHEAWDQIPEPKINYSESFHVSHLMCESLLRQEKLNEAQKWVSIHKSAATFRIDSGERIFMEARLEYEKKNFARAKELFRNADKMSKGRLFQNPDYADYLKFYKQK